MATPASSIPVQVSLADLVQLTQQCGQPGSIPRDVTITPVTSLPSQIQMPQPVPQEDNSYIWTVAKVAAYLAIGYTLYQAATIYQSEVFDQGLDLANSFPQTEIMKTALIRGVNETMVMGSRIIGTGTSVASAVTNPLDTLETAVVSHPAVATLAGTYVIKSIAPVVEPVLSWGLGMVRFIFGRRMPH